MLRRHIESTILEKAKYYPIVIIMGPRQSGKTTVAKYLFHDKPYVTLEDPDQHDFAKNDPKAFLKQFPNGALLDEVQNCPWLFSYLQGIVDTRQKPGEFILTGSQQFNLLAQVGQSLAGRAGLVELLPLTIDEIEQKNKNISLEELLFKGNYPSIYDKNIPPHFWYNDYIKTYLERDVRQLIHIKDFHTFHRFLRMCAARTGQLLNINSLSSDCGITHQTAKTWLSVLEASYLIHLLQPYHKNFNKRLIKSPKLYFYDTGLVCQLLGVSRQEDLIFHAMRGPLFETYVVSELIKGQFNQGDPSRLFFWRDNHGHEIDILFETNGKLLPIEIKSGQTVQQDFFKGLNYFSELAQDQIIFPTLIYGGSKNQHRTHARVFGWNKISSLVTET